MFIKDGDAPTTTTLQLFLLTRWLAEVPTALINWGIGTEAAEGEVGRYGLFCRMVDVEAEAHGDCGLDEDKSVAIVDPED